MSRVMRVLLVAGACALCAGRAGAGTVLTFEGLQNFEPVANYYDAGLGGLGSGPGPSYGITFSPYGLAFIPGLQQYGHPVPFPGDPSPPTVLLIFNTQSPYGAGYPTSVTMDVDSGFTQALSFYYIAIGRDLDVDVWSGPNGTGTMLAQEQLATTPEAFGSPTTIDFSGVASSVVFTGGNDQVAIDNIAFLSVVPEPPAWLAQVIGLACVYAYYRVKRRRPGVAR